MRKLILYLLLLGTSVFAYDFQPVGMRDSISVADTATGGVYGDTVYSNWQDIAWASKMSFYVKIVPYSLFLIPAVIDTNFASDSFFIDAQLSIDRSNVTITIPLDTLLTTDSSWTGNDALVTDSLRGSYMRARFIHRNGVRALPAALNKVYGKAFQLFYSIIY